VATPVYQRIKNPPANQSGGEAGWRLSYGALFSFGMIVVFAAALWPALSWPERARIFPIVIFGPLLVLSVANFIKDLRRRPWTESIKQAIDEAGIDEATFRKRTREILGWVVVFFLSLWLLGFPVGIPLATFVYLKLAARESWTTSILVTFGSWAFLVGVFGYVLDFLFPEAALYRLFSTVVPR